MRLGYRAAELPHPDGLCALLDDYYRGDGFADAARRRTLSDHYVAHRDGDATTAQGIVARLREAAPELGPLVLRQNDEGLLLRSAGVHVQVSADEVYAQEQTGSSGGVPVRRTVTVQALVCAMNELLEKRSISRRYLPLARSDETEPYIGIDRASAEVIDTVDAFDGRLEDLLDFARWRSRREQSLDDLREYSDWSRNRSASRSQRRVA